MKERKRGQKKRKKENAANAAYKWEVQREKLLMLYGIPLGSRLGFFFPPSKAVLHFDYLVLLKAIQAALFVSVRMGPQKKTKGSGPVIFPTVDFFFFFFFFLLAQVQNRVKFFGDGQCACVCFVCARVCVHSRE